MTNLPTPQAGERTNIRLQNLILFPDPHVPFHFLGLVLSKIEKHIQRENVIHAIESGCGDKLVEITNFCQ
jgi:hypothetical protein